MTSVTSMWTCHWARRRLQRYFDADPSARLTRVEVHRLEAHLATCERCTALAGDHRGLHRALLRRWAHRSRTRPQSPSSGWPPSNS